MQRRDRQNKKNASPKIASIKYPVRINKFIANAGVCSRRDADELIAEGKIKINGKVVEELGTKVQKDDVVKYNNKTLSIEQNVYVLLNKPKGFITTMDDPQNRKTVMDLVSNACEERIFPVGRLDRNTTGLLLLTNDGDLSQKMTHPSYKIKKIYQAQIDEAITPEHIEQIAEGLTLEDGAVSVDQISVLDPNRKLIGLEIHVGKNRIVRRIFEHLGYEVLKLDRTLYGPLTKKDLPRGQWRMLDDKEIVMLKNLL